MRQIDSARFHEAARGEAMFLALFIGADAGGDDAVARLESILADSPAGSWHGAQVRADQNAELARMFNIGEKLPALLLMRDEVVLYCAPIGDASDEDLGALLARAARLDMHQVREELEEERRNRIALFERRVCPAARRLR